MNWKGKRCRQRIMMSTPSILHLLLIVQTSVEKKSHHVIEGGGNPRSRDILDKSRKLDNSHEPDNSHRPGNGLRVSRHHGMERAQKLKNNDEGKIKKKSGNGYGGKIRKMGNDEGMKDDRGEGKNLGNDYNGGEDYIFSLVKNCEGLKAECKGRAACLEGIKCTGDWEGLSDHNNYNNNNGEGLPDDNNNNNNNNGEGLPGDNNNGT